MNSPTPSIALRVVGFSKIMYSLWLVVYAVYIRGADSMVKEEAVKEVMEAAKNGNDGARTILEQIADNSVHPKQPEVKEFLRPPG